MTDRAPDGAPTERRPSALTGGRPGADRALTGRAKPPFAATDREMLARWLEARFQAGGSRNGQLPMVW